MVGTDFDDFVRSLPSGTSRRSLLRRGAVAALGAAAFGAGLRRGAGALECRGRDAACRRDNQCCSGACRNNGTCAPAGVGAPCDPSTPSDCRSGVCGCAKIDTAGTPTGCTCRRATCTPVREEGCDESADCCDGFCLKSRGVCFRPQQQCIPEGQSCASAPTLCCPGSRCTGGVCTD